MIALLAATATVLSGFVPAEVRETHPEIMGCEATCLMAAAGWPFAFVVDIPGVSPDNSADLLGAVVGLNEFLLLPLAATFASWLVWSAGCVLGWSYFDGRRKRQGQ